ncbi:indole-3-glycerol phosphate synthase TrpC [Candidatus Woesearchaeota archaeon]|nr:indole-3-glycerol phosphate synthase TrpC [Candidatus Woesearchaeota archaeon]
MILDEIIKNKKEEIKRNRKNLPLDKFRSKLERSERDFKKAIGTGFNLIAEIKKGSPSKGIINENFSLEETARVYQQNKNVKAVSVLTDYKFFFMAPTCLRDVRNITNKPLLRKDFIIDEYQIYESRLYGADAVLLIARILTKEKIRDLCSIAKKYGMDCLVEVHDGDDIKKFPENVEIIGINNRNLDTLKIDLNTTLGLVSEIPQDKVIVSESGFNTTQDIDKVRDKVNAVLIGTSILESRDINNKINSLMGD